MNKMKRFTTTCLVLCIGFINLFATANNPFSITTDAQNHVVIKFGEVPTTATIDVKILNNYDEYVYNEKIEDSTVAGRKYNIKHLPNGTYTLKVAIGNTIKFQDIYKSGDVVSTDVATLTMTYVPNLKSKEGKVDVNLLCNSGNFEIRIIDENGNNVHEETHDATGAYHNRYNLNALPNGSYQFIVEMNDEKHEESFGQSVIIAD